MDLVHPDIDAYLDGLCAPTSATLDAMSARASQEGFPIVGPQVGRLMGWLAQSIGARRVLELGSGFGYSAWWFATMLGPEARLTLTDFSTEHLAHARHHLANDGLEGRLEATLAGDALAIMANLEGPFDVIFNDIDKEQYPQVLELSARLLRPGGLLICDNMLWYGRVLAQQDEATEGVRRLTRALFDDPRFDTILLPVRDGVTASRRLQ